MHRMITEIVFNKSSMNLFSKKREPRKTRPATPDQKEYLRRLGYKDVKGLTKQFASRVIDQLLDKEREAGKTFPCPYCKNCFGYRTKRKTTRKCSWCQNVVTCFLGKFYTESQFWDLKQKRWFKEIRNSIREDIKDDWREQKKFQKQGFSFLHGYRIHIGKHCLQAKHLEGNVILLEVAYNHPELLPPFDTCCHDTCECHCENIFS